MDCKYVSPFEHFVLKYEFWQHAISQNYGQAVNYAINLLDKYLFALFTEARKISKLGVFTYENWFHYSALSF